MRPRFSTFILTLGLSFSIACCFSLAAAAQETPAKKPAQENVEGQKKAPKKRKPNPAMAPIEDVAGLPRVLLIGDSISIGYTLQVRESLKGKANVHRPPSNCGPTTNGLNSLDKWLGEKKWDVIHFNWGLHDLKYLGPNGANLQDPNDSKNHQQVPPAEYEKNIRQLVKRLQQTNAKLLWRNTTPVPAGSKGRVEGDAFKYNQIAAKVMQENEIPVHDVYTLVKPNMLELMQPKGNVHFKPEGNKVLAQDVAAEVLKAIAPE